MKYQTWPLPEGLAADKNAELSERINSYTNTKEFYIKGIQIKPTEDAVKLIIEAYDLLGASMLIENSCYTKA